MTALDVIVGDKTYHVEVPATQTDILQVIVDGMPFQVRLCSETQSAAPSRQPMLEKTIDPAELAALLAKQAGAYKPRLSEYRRAGD